MTLLYKFTGYRRPNWFNNSSDVVSDGLFESAAVPTDITLEATVGASASNVFMRGKVLVADAVGSAASWAAIQARVFAASVGNGAVSSFSHMKTAVASVGSSVVNNFQRVINLFAGTPVVATKNFMQGKLLSTTTALSATTIGGRLYELFITPALARTGFNGFGNITYVGGQAVNTMGGTFETDTTFNLSGGSNSTPQAGDFVVVNYVIADDTDRGTPAIITSGYTTMAAAYRNSNWDTRMSVSSKFMGSTPDTVVRFGPTGTSTRGGAATIHVFRGVDPAAPYVGLASQWGTGNTFADPDPVTPSRAGSVVVALGGSASDNPNGVYTSSGLSGFVTARRGVEYSPAAGGGYFNWTSGEYDPSAFSTGKAADGNQSWNAVSFALQPSPVQFSNATTTRQIGKLLTDTVGTVGLYFAPPFLTLIAYAGTTSSTARNVARGLVATVGETASLIRSTAIRASAGVGNAADGVVSLAKNISASVSNTASKTVQRSLILLDSVGISSSTRNSIAKVVSAMVGTVGARVVNASTTLRAVADTTGSRLVSVSKSLSAIVGNIASTVSSRLTFILLSAGVAASATKRVALRVVRAASTNTVASVAKASALARTLAASAVTSSSLLRATRVSRAVSVAQTGTRALAARIRRSTAVSAVGDVLLALSGSVLKLVSSITWLAETVANTLKLTSTVENTRIDKREKTTVVVQDEVSTVTVNNNEDS